MGRFPTFNGETMGTWHAISPNPTADERLAKRGNCHLPILIDSGAIGTVVGMGWSKSWTRNQPLGLVTSAKSSRFGDGDPYPSIGIFCVKLTLPSEVANLQHPRNFPIAADVVQAPIPFLVSKKSHVNMRGKLDFSTAQLEIDERVLPQLKNPPIGHISLPATPLICDSIDISDNSPSTSLTNYPVLTEPALQPGADAQLAKIHKQLSRCIEFALTNLLKMSHRTSDEAHIKKYYGVALVTGWLVG